MTTEKKFQYELVYIAGEAVSFVPTGLAPSETMIVDFEKYYRPDGISDIQFERLKHTMRNLFDGKLKKSGAGEDILSTPLPPCSPEEKQLVLQSLLHRKSVLFQQLYDLGVVELDEIKHKLEHLDELNTEETLLVKTHLLHLVALNKLITSYKETQECINIEDIVYGSKQKDFDEDALRELLKQFVFFLLQSSHPLKDYTETNVKAPEFVDRLEKNPIGEKFTPFLETYKSNKFSIPPMIAKVLEATELDPKAMSEKVKEQVVLEQEAILNKIKELVPPTDPFWKSISTLTDPVSIVEQLHTQGIQNIDTIKRLEVEKSALETSVKTCEQAKKALQVEKAKIERNVKALQEELEKKEGNDNDLTELRNEMVAMKEDYENRIAALTEQGRIYLEEKQRYEARILEFTTANTQLLNEIDGLKERVRQLEEIQQEAETNIAALQARYESELQAERDRVAEKEGALAAAQQVIETTRQESDAKVEELATSKVALEVAKRTAIAKDAAIAALRKSLEEQETREKTLRNELAEKNQDEIRLTSDITNARASIEELNNELEELQERLGEAEGATQERDQLQAFLDEKETELADLQTALDQCNDEKERLKGEVSAPAAEIARLGAELDSTKEEYNEALAKQQELTTTVESLRAQLTQEKTQVAQEKSSKEQLEKKLADADETIEWYRKDNEEDDKKKSELQNEITSLKKKATDITVAAQRAHDASVATLEESFHEQIDTLQTSMKEEHEKSMKIIRDIATAIQTDGRLPEIPTDIPQPEIGALTTILQALKTSIMPQLTATQAQAFEKEHSFSNICYLIFFTSFAWQTNFPLVKKSTTTVQNEASMRQLFVNTFFPSLFNGGYIPKENTVPVSPSIFKSGLYSDIELKSAGATTRASFQGKLQNKMGIIRRFLHIFNKIARSMEIPSSDGKIEGLVELDIVFLHSLHDKILLLLPFYTHMYKSTTDTLEKNFAVLIRNTLTLNQPQVNPEILNMYLVFDKETGTKIVKEVGSNEPTKLNYAVLFYSFLVVMRDYLNLMSEKVVNPQCPLPAILKK
jgi:DNA repair exonuclease SbcCD ATPase subunit